MAKSNLSAAQVIGRNFVWVVLAVLAVWTILPLVWAISASFKPALEVYQTPPSVIPREFTLDGYRGVFAFPGFWRYLFNSIFLAVSSTAISLLISMFAGYGFARYAFRWRHLMLMIILVPRILPRAALIVPLYQVFANLGLLNTYTGLIIAYTSTAVPMATWILTGFFQGVPKELEESAMLDGANLWQILSRIVVPVALPGLLTVVIFSVRQAWNEFPFVLAFTTSSDMRTLPYQLYMLRDTMGIQDWPLLNAFTLVTIIPILVIYLRFEKQVISGMVSGAVK